jgi:DNA invertase Pin-like site-specific DNA recombinase
MIRAALYGRVSTKDKGQEVENQLLEMREFCRRMGWEIVREYVDHESALADRAEFSTLWLHASQKRFDVVVFWSLDRFSREGVLPTLQYLQRLTDYGIGFRSYTEQFLDSCGPFKDAIIGFLAAIAKQERIRISERTKAGLARVRAKGVKLGRRPVVVDVALIRSLRDSGKSWRAIGRQLNVAPVTLQKACDIR